MANGRAQEGGLGARFARWESRVFRFCEGPRLAWQLALLALVLSSPALCLGLYLDDVIAHYIYSGLPDADTLFRMYAGVFGVSDGRASNLWQMEHGYAPWWTYEHLVIRLYRPLSVASHRLDAALGLGSALLAHAHSLLWLGLLVLAVTAMYRRAHGPLLGGMAALLFAVDHTHGFEIGYITNRHTLIAAMLGALALAEHLRFRSAGQALAAWLAPVFYALSLLASEAAVAACGYFFAYALFVERGSFWRRALTVMPYAAITVVWRTGYLLAGYGAHGSGVYVDPAADPARFVTSLGARGPVLLQAAFSPLPADLFTVASAQEASLFVGFSLLLCALLGAALWPLLARDRHARFWGLGMLLSLVPASATFASNRQLLFTSFGALALMAQAWHLHAIEWRGRTLDRTSTISRGLATGFLFVRLAVSPLLLPLTTCSIAFTTPLQRSADGVADDLGGKDVVFVTAPDDMTIRLAQLERRLDGRPLPRRFRMLSLGAHAVIVTRTDARTLELVYAGGLLSDPFTELFRDRRIAMHVGERIELTGLSTEVLGVTNDGRAERVRFRFDRPLEAPSLVFYAWQRDRLRPWRPPSVGGRVNLPAAQTRWWLW